MKTRADIGREGEQAVIDFMRSKGYLIAERNWRCGRSEIDIIAMKDEYVVFVEVKTRSVTGLTSPEAAADASKCRALMRAAAAYLKMNRLECYEVRMDLAAVDLYPDGHYEVRYVENAFESHW